MEFDCQHSLHISSQITYKNDLTYHRKYYIKYAKYFNLSTSLRLAEKREWHLFFKRMKVLRKIDSTAGFQSTLEPSLPFAIEVLKGRRSLSSIPIKFKLSEKQNPSNKLYACKLIKCLKTPKEVALSLQGKIDSTFQAILNQIQVLRKITSFKIQISSQSPNQVDISQGVRTIFRALNSFSDLSKITFHLQDIQLSDQSLRELFRMDKLKRPVKEMELLTDRLLDIEDQFDDFAMPPAIMNNDIDAIWEKFNTIETLAGSLTYLHLQPLLRSALDHSCLKYFFTPLAKLQNLKFLKIDMPNIELTDNDVKALSTSISCLQNLKVFKILLQFGMIMQRTLDNFFGAFAVLNLREVYFYLTYSTMSEISEFYRAVAQNKDIEIVSYDMTYLANVQYDPTVCEGLLGCRRLKSLTLAENPLMKGLLPSKEKFNMCFRGLFSSLANTFCLESFNMQSIKTCADNDNAKVIADTLPQLPYLKELIFDVDWKDYMIDYEIGMKLWEAVIQKPQMKTLIFTGLFRGAEHLLPFIRRRLDDLVELESLWVKFESETLSPEQIVLFVKRTTEHKVLKDLRLYFRVRQPLTNKLIERTQQILNKDKYLKKCLIEIQTNSGQQSISSESKGLFRPGLDFYYF